MTTSRSTTWVCFLLSTLALILLLLPSGSCLERIRYRDVLLKNKKNKKNNSKKDAPLLLDAARDHPDVQELYFTQRLDHFDATNLATYQQRYFYSDRYLVEKKKDDDNIDNIDGNDDNHDQSNDNDAITFLCVGGEGPGFDTSVLVDSVHCTGDMLELAQRLSHDYQRSVHVYALEHRYYGKSYPTFTNAHANAHANASSPVTIEHLKYLSSRQALEDLAHFVSTTKTQQTQSSSSSLWVTFGGSYPGFMSMNARVAYPHLIHAAVSNSAPLALQVDFPQYSRQVSWDLKYDKIGGSEQCYQIVKQGHEQAVDLLHTAPTQLARMFHICHPETALLDRNNANLLLGDGLIAIPAQGNDPACTEPKCPNIRTLCDTLVSAAANTNNNNNTTMTALQVLAAYNHDTDHHNHDDDDDDDKCTSVDWKEVLDQLSKTEVDDEGTRSWLWQTCTEVGFYQTCHETCPYASFFHLVDMDLEICRVAYNVTNVYDNVQASLDHYGGLDRISSGDGYGEASRILSVNGNVDPWSALGLRTSPKYSLPVKMVDGASHHFWTHPVQPTDAVEIVQIREYLYSVVMEWLGIEDGMSSSSSIGGSSGSGGSSSGIGSSGISGESSSSSSSLRAGRVD
jgi:serine protease 16